MAKRSKRTGKWSSEDVVLVKLAEHPLGFTLYERVNLSSQPWTSLKLTAKRRKKKRTWNFGWHSERNRLSMTHDTEKLQRWEPEIYDWVIGVMKAYFEE